MTFKEFIAAHMAGALENDATWRNYEILGGIRPLHIRGALKLLRMSYAGELAIPECRARYGINTDAMTKELLGAWWIWSRLSDGHRVRGVRLREPATAPLHLGGVPTHPGP